MVRAASAGFLKRHRLAELVAEHRGRPGIRRLEVLLALEPRLARSELELLFDPVWRGAGLPRPSSSRSSRGWRWTSPGPSSSWWSSSTPSASTATGPPPSGTAIATSASPSPGGSATDSCAEWSWRTRRARPRGCSRSPIRAPRSNRGASRSQRTDLKRPYPPAAVMARPIAARTMPTQMSQPMSAPASRSAATPRSPSVFIDHGAPGAGLGLPFKRLASAALRLGCPDVLSGRCAGGAGPRNVVELHLAAAEVA